MADFVEQARVREAREVFVGPRPFERSEQGLFFGRDREISELLSLVISSRAVLCYAPSGAGKTSLINAGLQPKLEQEGFEVFPSTRVRGVIPEGVAGEKVANIYVFNALLSLAGEAAAPPELMGRSIADFLAVRPHRTDEDGFPAPRILIFDQFEELLTAYPDHWQERDGFFLQVHDALQADPLLRVVFVMREDYLARTEPYTRHLKPLQLARFRLNLLGPDGALAAVTAPLKGTGRRFKEGVAAALIEELLKVRIETAQGEAVEVVGEFVEPVQLQVVCRNLWTSLPHEVEEISHEHVQAYGDVDQALQEFYENCLAQAKSTQGAHELYLRQWFETHLITPAGTRGIVFRDAKQTAGLPNAVVDFLENRHLIRGEWRAGSRWYELTHDRFIEPIQRANDRWRARRQARRNRLVMSAATFGVVLLLMLALIPTLLRTGQIPPQPADVSTIVAATVVVQANARETAQVQAEADIALSRSRQLAAEALLVNDPQLALLLAVQANRFSDTPEARRSLHKILSRQAVMDGEFLQELDAEIISPALVKRLEDHDGWVLSVAFSPDGRRFVSGGEGSALFLWDMSAGVPVGLPLIGHRSNVLSVAFSPDGKLIASTGLDSQVLLWEASNGQPYGAPLLGHTGLVTSVAFSPDGRRLASGGEDGTIRIWDIASGESVSVVSPGKAVWSLAWSPDGRLLASGGADTFVSLWETNEFSQVRSLAGHRGLIRSMTWSPNGQSLASGSIIGQEVATDGEVIVWDAATGEIIARPLPENALPVRAVAFDPSGKILAIGRYDGSITLWDTIDGQVLRDSFKAHDHWIMSLAFSPDGRYMVSGSIDRTVALWDLYAPTRSIAVSSGGEIMAASQGTVISLWDLSSGESVPEIILYGHTEDVLDLDFSPDGSILASAGQDDTIRLWDVGSGREREVARLTGHASDVLALDISPDGRFLVSADSSGLVIKWDLATQAQLGNYQHSEAVIEVLFGKNGSSLEMFGKDGSLIVLDINSGEIQVELLPGAEGGVTISNLAYSQDGQRVAYYQEASRADDSPIPQTSKNERAHGLEIWYWSDSFDPTVNPNDIDFIIVKATEGLRTDRKFNEFLAPIQSVPMRGAYHVFQEDIPWQEQADYFLSVVQDKGFDFYLLTWLTSLAPKDRTTFLMEAEQWIRYVDEKAEGRVLLGTIPAYMDSLGSEGNWMKEWPLWVFQYPFTPDRFGTPTLPKGVEDWKIWQYTDQGNGAEYGLGAGAAVLNVYNGTPQEMRQWLDNTGFSIYDGATGDILRPKQPIRMISPGDITISLDGAYLAYTGEGTVSILDAGTGDEITALSMGGNVAVSLGFAPNSYRLVIGTANGTMLFWDLSLLYPAAEPTSAMVAACSQITRNLTLAEWQQFVGNAEYILACPNLPAP